MIPSKFDNAISTQKISFSALTLMVGDRKGIWPVKKLDVGLLVVMI